MTELQYNVPHMQFHSIQLQTMNEEWKMSWSISCTCLFTNGSR